MSVFGEKIKKSRLDKSEPLKKIASFLNMDQTYLHQIEQGKRNASKDQVLKLANCLNIDEKHLFAVYLEDRILQAQANGRPSNRLENLSLELSELETRQIRTKIHKPEPPLDISIQNIIYYKGSNKVSPYERALPDGSVQLVINLDENESIPVSGNKTKSRFSLKKAWIAGVQEQYTTYPLTHEEATLSVQFTTGGFYALTHLSVTEIKNRFIEAEQIFGPSVLLLREKLLSCNDIESIFRNVEGYFLKKIRQQNNEYAIVRHLVDHISEPLRQLVQKTGYSHKHVIHLFKKHVGVSPKQFQRIYRFNRSLNDILAINGEIDWADIVFKHGYYDQPHFIKEFRHFSGINPRSYLETGSTCSKLLHLDQIR